LEALLGSPGRVLTKTELMQAAWGDTAVEESNLSVQIAALRKQLGPTADGGDWITTIPRVGYRFVGLPAKEPIERIAEPKASPIKREHRPSIAVLPFANLSREKEQEYLADGITEDIITALTRFRWFFVIARNSSFAYKSKSLDAKQVAQELGVQYLLEGSVRRSGQQTRISVQLVDAASGKHIGPSATSSNWPTCLLFKMKSLSAWQALLSRNYSELKVCKRRHGILAI
jgi:TolB-like protein